MGIWLADDVVVSHLDVWLPGPHGPFRPAEQSAAPAGAAVALGPPTAGDEQVRAAVAELTRLVRAGGVVLAGAGVELAPGFRSARLAGAPGDPRDAVLAALRVLGADGAHRLGDRAGFLVALFGPESTKRVGAAAARAIDAGQWAAVHLAAAASDTLGPEQLEQVLALRAPEGVEPVPGGAPSLLARHLDAILAPVSRPRRHELITDLWARVLAHRADLARRERPLRTQSRRDRVADITARRRHFEDEDVLRTLRSSTGEPDPSLADAARWTPPDRYWYGRYERLVEDALAATALLRTAVAVAGDGLDDGLARSVPLLAAARAQLDDRVATASARKVTGLTGIPHRPGAYVRDIHRRLAGAPPEPAELAAYVRPRLAAARDYALVVIETAGELLGGDAGVPVHVLRTWAARDLRSWRDGAGYTAVRPPATWVGIPPWTVPLLGDQEQLIDRLQGRTDAPDVEVVGDLLWYADLFDALAQLYGHDVARSTPGTAEPWFDHDPEPESEPLSPRLDSVTQAIAGAAQLVALGAVPAKGARTWQALTTGLLDDATITEALTGEFPVPAPIAALDGATVPGCGRVEVARNARMLATWSDYMGNCIAGPAYVDDATHGRCALVGLYDGNGLLLVNAELSPRRPAALGWRVTEIAGRFNDAPDEALERRFRDWAARIPGTDPDAAGLAPPEEPPFAEPAPDRRAGRRGGSHRVAEVATELQARAERAWRDQVDDRVIAAFAAVAGAEPGTALVRIRRLGARQLTDACRHALHTRAVRLDQLWTATGYRPLTAAVEALDPALRRRFDRISLLLGDAPLPKSLRELVHRPAVAEAYALERAARATRRAIGRLTLDDDQVIAHAVATRPSEPLLCALIVMITCRAPGIGLTPVSPPRAATVPGYPVTDLAEESGPWSRAFASARELGADTDAFWTEIAEHGLRVPTSWLSAGGWPALWAHAHSPHT